MLRPTQRSARNRAGLTKGIVDDRLSRFCVFLGATLSSNSVGRWRSSAGFAADFGYSVKDIPPPPASGRAWYLKGTIGMGNRGAGSNRHRTSSRTGDFHYRSPQGHEDLGALRHRHRCRSITAGCASTSRANIAASISSSATIVTTTAGACPAVTGCGSNSFTADIESWVGLANAYIDLGTWRGVTPYVGGGIGIASVSVQGFEDVNVPHNGWAYGTDHTETNFAWALYAGVSYDVTSQFTMDLGYRYLDMGDAKSGARHDVPG